MARRRTGGRIPADLSGHLAALRDELERGADEGTRQGTRRFFREEITCYGVKTPVVRGIARRYFRPIRQAAKGVVFGLCEDLMRSGYQEEAIIAADWAFRMKGAYEPADFLTFENWIGKYVDNWAKCDTLCTHAAGSCIGRFPEHLPRLKSWTASGNRWVRRASAVTLVLPARRGLYPGEVLDIASRLLHDSDDLVQKGCGWLLREAGRCHQEEVFRFVMDHRGEMARTSLRYAIGKMPAGWKRQAMER